MPECVITLVSGESDSCVMRGGPPLLHLSLAPREWSQLSEKKPTVSDRLHLDSHSSVPTAMPPVGLPALGQ